MHIVNQKKLDAILPAEELYVQQVLVWYSLNQSKKLYSGKNLPAWFEELGCPKQLIPRMVQAYIHYQEFNGKSDEDVVKQEILAALMPHKQNPEGTSIEGILVGPSDIFSYQGRYFVLQRESEFREGGRAKVLETNDAGWICLLLGIVIKTAKCEPLAYALLKAPEQQPRLLEEGSAPAHLLL